MLTRVQILVYRHLIDNAHSTMELYRKPIDKSILFYLFLMFLMLLVPALLSFLFFFFVETLEMNSIDEKNAYFIFSKY